MAGADVQVSPELLVDPPGLDRLVQPRMELVRSKILQTWAPRTTTGPFRSKLQKSSPQFQHKDREEDCNLMLPKFESGPRGISIAAILLSSGELVSDLTELGCEHGGLGGGPNKGKAEQRQTQLELASF
eukprot:666455-Hanusia_phi.AAC.3